MITNNRRSGRSIWRPGMIIGASLMTLLVLTALIAPLFLTGAANELSENRALPPSAEHLLGTNDFGQDNLARVLVATRLTLIMTVLATLTSVLGGLIIGVAIWLSPHKVRQWCLRILETAVAYPTLITALVVAAILLPSAGTAVIALGIAGMPGFARVTANLAQQVTNSEYFTTAKFLGVPPFRLATRHIIPGMAEPLLILSTTLFSATLMEISALSFVGLGVQPPQYDLGSLLNNSLDALYTQPIEALGPAVMIVLASISAMLIGDALAAHANPRTNKLSAQKKTRSAQAIHENTSDAALVRVNDLRVNYLSQGHPTELIHGIDLHIFPGEILGIVGESGSGKSLTAMSIAGLLADDLQMDAQQLRVGGMDMLGSPTASQLARQIGIVYQDPGSTFSPSRTMGKQLTEVLRTHFGAKRFQARQSITRALENVGITHPAARLKQYPHELSGGMRQRAMIAAALPTEPALLIADEPTTALDVTVQIEVLRQFRKLRDTKGTSILFISHDIGVVQELCDRVLVMRKGSIVEELTPEQIISRQVTQPYTRKLLEAVPVLSTTAEPGTAQQASTDTVFTATAEEGIRS